MTTFWAYFWPPFVAGLLVGAIAGLVAFRRRPKRNLSLAIGLVLSLAAAALWHGPFGAADRLAAAVDHDVRAALVYNEIPEVSGHIQHRPLARRVFLSGPANDFQQGELVRIIGEIPGVGKVTWSNQKGGLPLIVEALGVAVLGFLFGLLLAYLLELRRRYNAQWKW